ncbi:MAG: DUF2203 domain-containing protein, partial [Pirellulaceae bacterium]
TRFRLQFIGRGGDELAYMFASEIRALERDLEEDERQLDGFVAELEQLGIEPEGLVFGLVDFPTVLDGQYVYFCWRYGESGIRYWHTLTGGFVNRQPLETARLHAEPELVGSS